MTEGTDVRQLRAFAAWTLALAVLGAPVGLIWSALAPRARYVATDDGLRLADPTTQALIAADGWFALLTAVAGALCGAVAQAVARRRVAALLGLAAGGLAAAGAAFLTGTAGGDGPNRLTLTAPGVLLGWPLLAVIVFGALEAAAAYRDSPLRRPYGRSPDGVAPPGAPGPSEPPGPSGPSGAPGPSGPPEPQRGTP